MAISPPGDIVLDVMRAAEPDKVQAAREQLQRIAQGAAPSASFSAALSSAPGAKVEKSETPYQQFEAMVLGTFLQSMLPEGTESVYGEGMSGDMWKSLLAQELGDAVAARGGIGIANRLLADHYREGDRKVALSGVPGGPVQAALDDQNRLSRALVQELQRKAAQPLIDSAVGAREPSAE